jgi:predicted RNA-binding Zn-ribbon protein involved in translation (DUF1610 family)
MTLKQDCFVTEYLALRNGTQAAIKAGYSPKRADQQAYENLRKPEIQRAIKDRLNEQGITESVLLQKIGEGQQVSSGSATSVDAENRMLKPVCPNCSSTSLTCMSRDNTRRYYRCRDCGKRFAVPLTGGQGQE